MISFNKDGWEKKKRTRLSSLVVGDVFALEVVGGGYAFGRLAAKIFDSFVAEFFDKIKSKPELGVTEYEGMCVAIAPIEIDSYSLFDRKIEGDWRIIGRDAAYAYPDPTGRIFKFGMPPNFKYVNMNGDFVGAPADFGDIPYLETNGDYRIQELIKECIAAGSMK